VLLSDQALTRAFGPRRREQLSQLPEDKRWIAITRAWETFRGPTRMHRGAATVEDALAQAESFTEALDRVIEEMLTRG